MPNALAGRSSGRHAGSPSANVVGPSTRDAKLAGMATDDTAMTADASETADLDRDVWRPFVAAYADLDIDALLDIYSDDLIRASEPTGTAQDRTGFAHDMAGFFSSPVSRVTASGSSSASSSGSSVTALRQNVVCSGSSDHSPTARNAERSVPSTSLLASNRRAGGSSPTTTRHATRRPSSPLFRSSRDELLGVADASSRRAGAAPGPGTAPARRRRRVSARGSSGR
jgi:ketosteroid isomerase-like protein